MAGAAKVAKSTLLVTSIPASESPHPKVDFQGFVRMKFPSRDDSASEPDGRSRHCDLIRQELLSIAIDTMTATKAEFENLWSAHQFRVVGYCRSYLGETDADDVTQCVAARAWRGWPSFRGDASFLTWVMHITENEVKRWQSKRYREQLRLVALDPDLHFIEAPGNPVLVEHEAHVTSGNEARPAPTSGNQVTVLEQAVSAKFLTDREAFVLHTRSEHDETWSELGARLGLSANGLAAIHCRAVPKLRVFVLCHRADLCGGLDAIRAAFEQSCRDDSHSLTEAESDLFQRRVLDRANQFRPKGWETTLRSACEKVARHLSGFRL